MKELFVDYNLSLELKELGFKEKCLASYYTYNIENLKKDKYDYKSKFIIEITDSEDYIMNGEKSYYVACPLIYQVFDWFRNKHNLHGVIHQLLKYKYDVVVNSVYCIHLSSSKYDLKRINYSNLIEYNTYEEAETVCINQMIDFIKQK